MSTVLIIVIIVWFLLGLVGAVGFYNSERTDWYETFREDLPNKLKRMARVISFLMFLLGPLGLLISLMATEGDYTLTYKGKKS